MTDMDITCPKCGATNRSTSRFCARCGEPLPQPTEIEQDPQTSTGGLNLPWLQGVQERSTRPTNRLPDEEAAEEVAPQAAQVKSETAPQPSSEPAPDIQIAAQVPTATEPVQAAASGGQLEAQ